jgi:hypothetical protein
MQSHPIIPALLTADIRAARPFGYHDDSFAWATLETDRNGCLTLVGKPSEMQR